MRSVASACAIVVVAALALGKWVTGGPALILGIAIALTLGNPWSTRSKRTAQWMLTWSVVGLGAGMNLAVVGRVGLHGLGYTALGIAVALSAGTWLGRRLSVGRDVALLISVGTSICGGSAIAAVAPVLRASERDVSVAFVTVFCLNAVALVLFPPVGHALGLSQGGFGLWCALAIHDTSSVVGAAARYGEEALGVATAAKLARALWIIPVAFGVSIATSRRDAAPGHVPDAARPKPKRPWFIGGFLLMATVTTFVPLLAPAARVISDVAHRTLTLSLFLIGLVLGAILWLVLGTSTLLAIARGWIGT